MSFGARTSRGEESNTKSILPYMGKTVVGTVGKHGRETGRNRVGGRGYLPNPGGTVPAARGWRSADAPPCPVATAPGLGHAPGSGNRGGPLPHRATVGRLVPAGRGGGEVCAHHGGGHGQPSWLTPEQEAAVAEEAAQGTFTMAADVRQWVAQQFGVTYRPKGIYGLLRRVRCRPKVPRPIHTKADLGAQEAWKKATVFN